LIPTAVKEVKVPSHGCKKLLCNISNYLPINKAYITSNKASMFSSTACRTSALAITRVLDHNNGFKITCKITTSGSPVVQFWC